MDDNENGSIDILIIGGGISGLTSAYKITEKEKSLNIVILEESSILGGQISSCEAGELGARYFTQKQYHIYELLEKLEINFDNVSNQHQCLIEDILANDLKKSEFWAKSQLIVFEVKMIMARIELTCTDYEPGKFKISKNYQTVERFIVQNLIFEKSKKILRLFVTLVCGTAPSNIKLSEFFSICNSGGGFQNLINLYIKTDEDYLYEFSSNELLEKFEIILNKAGVKIQKQTKVTEIFHYPNYALVRDSSGNVFYTSILIIALPWNKVLNINIFPSLPKEMKTIKSDKKYYITSFISEYAKYQPWLNLNSCGSFINLDDPPLIAYEYELNKIAGFVLHNHFGFTDIAKNIILQKLSEEYGEAMISPTNFYLKTFEQNLLLNLPPTTSWNRIIFSSTTCGTAYRGLLSGAVQSGYRAAINALLILRPQNVSWHDIDQIQKAKPLKGHANRWQIFFSRINLFDYSVIGLTVIILSFTIGNKMIKN